MKGNILTGVYRAAFVIAVAAVLMLAALGGTASAEYETALHLFYNIDCPHCKEELAFLDKIQPRYPQLKVHLHEITQNYEEAVLFERLSKAYGTRIAGVPATFIGGRYPIFGFNTESTTGAAIEGRIRNCIENGCPDPLDRLSAGTMMQGLDVEDLLLQESPGPLVEGGLCPGDIPCITGEDNEGAQEEAEPVAKAAEEPAIAGEVPPAAEAPGTKGPEEAQEAEAEEETLSLPIIGKVDARKTALPVLTVVIAGLDGFNPCAFFVLFTLLGMLIHLNSRTRMLMVGGIFVFFSGFVYFMFMAAWLNVFLLAGQVRLITTVAGAIALVIAFVNIKDFFFFKRGVSLSIADSAKPKLFDRMRKLMRASSLPSMIAGTVVLAVAANAYELLCTAGFPMVFTRVLTLEDLPTATYYVYLVFYNVVYVIPLAVIVLLFTATLGSRHMTEKHGQLLKLLSGVMMLYLGLIIVLNPSMLSNLLVAAGLLAGSLATTAIVMKMTGSHGAKHS